MPSVRSAKRCQRTTSAANHNPQPFAQRSYPVPSIILESTPYLIGAAIAAAGSIMGFLSGSGVARRWLRARCDVHGPK